MCISDTPHIPGSCPQGHYPPTPHSHFDDFTKISPPFPEYPGTVDLPTDFPELPLELPPEPIGLSFGGTTIPCVLYTLEDGAKCPEYKSAGASGADLFAFEDGFIPAGRTKVVRTGVRLEILNGYEGQVRSRSGLAAKNQVFVLNSPGTIDSDYRGEIMVILANVGLNDFEYKKGDRIAQLVIVPVVQAFFTSGIKLSPTERGEGGLGSTGK